MNIKNADIRDMQPTIIYIQGQNISLLQINFKVMGGETKSAF